MRRLGLCLCLVLLSSAALARAEDPPPPPAPAVEAPDAAALAKDLASTDLDARRKAAYALYGLGEKAVPALPALAKALADEDEYVRTTAKKAIARLVQAPAASDAKPWVEAVPVLLALLKDSRAAVRRDASVTLWWAGPVPEREELLLDTALELLSDADADLRANAVGMLAKRLMSLPPALATRREAVLAAIASKARDPDDRVRHAVALGLGAGPHPAGFEALLELCADPELVVRFTALNSLSGLRAPSAEAAARRDAILIAGLDDVEPQVRSAAAVALWSLGPPAALEPLLKAAREDPEPSVRGAALGALGEIGDPRALARVRAGLDDRDGSVRSAAAVALVGFGPDAAPCLPRLVRLLDDEEAGGQAALAIGRLGPLGASALKPLLRLVEHPRHAILAAGALNSLAFEAALPRAAIPDLLRLLPVAPPYAEVNLAHALASFPSLPPEVGTALLALYASPEGKDLRSSVVQAMTKVEPATPEILVVFRAHAGSADFLDRFAALGLVLRGTAEERARGIDLLLATPDADTGRYNALWLLVDAGPAGAGAAPRIEAELEAADAATPGGSLRRLLCAGILLSQRGPSAAGAKAILLAALRDVEGTGSSRTAADLLGKAGDASPEVLDALVERLQAGPARDMARVEAARALARLGSREPRVLDALLRAAETPGYGLARTAAASALFVLAAK